MYLGASVLTQPIIVCLKSKRSWVNTQNLYEMKASYSSACVLCQCYCAGKFLACKRTCLERWQYLRNGKQNCTLTFICTYVHLNTWGFTWKQTQISLIYTVFHFLKIMDIAKPLGFIPFSPFSVIPWYLQIVNIQTYLNK